MSPNLALIITVIKGGTNKARNDSKATKLKLVIRALPAIKVVPGVLIIGENKVYTIKKISLNGNPGDMKIETTRKTAFSPI